MADFWRPTFSTMYTIWQQREVVINLLDDWFFKTHIQNSAQPEQREVAFVTYEP